MLLQSIWYKLVIGVDVSSHVRNEFAGNRPDMPTNKMRNAGSLDTLFRIFESQAHNIGKLQNRAVDFWIKPDTSSYGLAEFHRTSEIATAGVAAALGTISELKQRLADLERRLRMPPENVRRLLIDYVTRLERLAAQPEWYNSISSNCTTNLFYNRRATVPLRLKPKIFLNGLSAHALYQLGFIESRLHFVELQSRCAIRERAISAGDADDFSLKIRELTEMST